MWIKKTSLMHIKVKKPENSHGVSFQLLSPIGVSPKTVYRRGFRPEVYTGVIIDSGGGFTVSHIGTQHFVFFETS